MLDNCRELWGDLQQACHIGRAIVPNEWAAMRAEHTLTVTYDDGNGF